MTDVTYEVVNRAQRIRALLEAERAFGSGIPLPEGLHRRQIVARLGLTNAEYATAIQYAVKVGWLEVHGHGSAARVTLTTEGVAS